MSVIGVAPWGTITGRDDIAKHGIGVGFCTRNLCFQDGLVSPD